MPVNPISRLPENAKFEVIVNGLSLLYFSDAEKRAEICFLDVPEHVLELTILEKPTNRIIFERQLDKGSDITINKDSDSMGASYAPDNSSDAKKFSKLVDFHKFYDNGVRVKQASKFFARLCISDAVFFTKCLSEHPVKKVWIENGQTMTEDLGHIGKVPGGKIHNPQSGIEINGEPVKEVEMEKSYIIGFRYRCVGDDSEDFKYFYDVLDGTTGRPKYLLAYDPRENACRTEIEKAKMKRLAERLEERADDEKSRSREDELKLAGELEKMSRDIRDRKACQTAVLGEVPVS